MSEISKSRLIGKSLLLKGLERSLRFIKLDKEFKQNATSILENNSSLSLYGCLKNKLEAGTMDHTQAMYFIEKSINQGKIEDIGKLAIISLRISLICENYRLYGPYKLIISLFLLFAIAKTDFNQDFFLKAITSIMSLFNSNKISENDKMAIGYTIGKCIEFNHDFMNHPNLDIFSKTILFNNLDYLSKQSGCCVETEEDIKKFEDEKIKIEKRKKINNRIIIICILAMIGYGIYYKEKHTYDSVGARLLHEYDNKKEAIFDGNFDKNNLIGSEKLIQRIETVKLNYKKIDHEDAYILGELGIKLYSNISEENKNKLSDQIYEIEKRLYGEVRGSYDEIFSILGELYKYKTISNKGNLNGLSQDQIDQHIEDVLRTFQKLTRLEKRLNKGIKIKEGKCKSSKGRYRCPIE